MPKPSNELVESLSKWGTFVLWVLIGLAGKFGLEMVRGREFSKQYVIGSGLLAICAGWLVYGWCIGHPSSSISPGIVVAAASLVSRDIILFVTMVDWMGVLKLLTNKSTKKRRDE